MEDEFTDKAPCWFKRHIDYGMFIPCRDHTKFLKDGSVIFEPYSVRMEELERLIFFCKEKKLEFRILGKSFYSPESTFRIHILPKKR